MSYEVEVKVSMKGNKLFGIDTIDNKSHWNSDIIARFVAIRTVMENESKISCLFSSNKLNETIVVNITESCAVEFKIIIILK